MIELINPNTLESMQEKQATKKSAISIFDLEVLEYFSEVFAILILRNLEV